MLHLNIVYTTEEGRESSYELEIDNKSTILDLIHRVRDGAKDLPECSFQVVREKDATKFADGNVLKTFDIQNGETFRFERKKDAAQVTLFVVYQGDESEQTYDIKTTEISDIARDAGVPEDANYEVVRFETMEDFRGNERPHFIQCCHKKVGGNLETIGGFNDGAVIQFRSTDGGA